MSIHKVVAFLLLPFILLLFSLYTNSTSSAQSSTPLATLASTMAPGTWAELATNNIDATLKRDGNALVYTDNIKYDPVTRQLFFVGSDHEKQANFSSYTEATNTWQILPKPAWFPSLTQNNGMMHGNDQGAIDQVNGIYYGREAIQARQIWGYNTRSQQWSLAGTLDNQYPTNVTEALEYFPEAGGLVWVKPGIVMLLQGGTWVPIATGLNTGGTYMFAEYDPVHKVLLFWSIGGKQMYKMDRNRTVTTVANPPVSMYTGSGLVGVLTVDPVSGTYLYLTPENRDFYTYNVLTDTWHQESSPTKPSMLSSGVVGTPLGIHGVTLFVACGLTSNCHLYLYKHSAGGSSPPPLDTTPPTVSITSPSVNATVGGNIQVDATASDNLGVVGVQFRLDGSNLSAEDTSFPYSLSWDTSSAINGNHTLTALARDLAGNITVSAPVPVAVSNAAPPPQSPPPPSGTFTFAEKCSQAGVLNCFGFDDPNQLLYVWTTGTVCDAALAGKTWHRLTNARGINEGNTVATIANGQCVYPEIDAGLKHSGNGSLKFTIPSQSSANSSGFFTEPFKRNPNDKFAYIAPGSPLGNVVYWQFRQYFDPTMLNTKYICIGGNPSDPGCYGWKQIIWYGNPPLGASSSNMEITHNSYGQSGVPGMYGQQGNDFYGIQDIRGCTYNFNGQNTYPEPPCIRYKGGQWMEFTVRVEIRGAPNAPQSRIQMWVDGQLAIDFQQAKIDWSGVEQGLGQFQITPYHTNKDANHVHPVAYTWYDDVIISTQPIPMGSGGTPPPPGGTPPPPGGTPPPPGGTPPPPSPTDTTPPVISNILDSSVSANSATITWLTDEASDSQVEYGTTRAYGNQTTLNPSLTTSHSQTLSNLSPGTNYYFRVKSRDGAGNLSVSAIQDFTHAGSTADTTPPVISTIVSSSISSSSATITWLTDEASDSQVEYGTTTSYGNQTTLNPTQVTSHSETLSSLTPGTNYNYRVKSRDTAGNLSVSANRTFSTEAGPPGETVPPTVSITSPGANSTVSGMVTVSVNATDNIGVVGVRFKLDGLDLGSEDTTAPFSVSWNTSTTTNGVHNLTAVARDSAGNHATSGIVTTTVANAALPPPSLPNPTPPPIPVGETKFSIPQEGGQSWTITGGGDSLTLAHAEVQPSYSSRFSGLAIFGFRLNGVVVTEASVPALPAVTSGRIYAEVNGPVNTGIALANPTVQDALVSFYFTDANGNNFRTGSFTLKARSQLAAFLDQAPFNVGASIQGTFTFTSTVRLGVIALRGFINERSEYLITTLPVSDVEHLTGEPIVLSHFADSGGWTTRLILTNPSDSPISGTINFLDPSGNKDETLFLTVSGNTVTGSTASYTIPARSFSEVVTGNRGDTIRTGSVRVTPSGNIAPSGSGIFSFRFQGITVTEAGVNVLPAGDAFRMYAEVSSTAAQVGSIDSGLAIANPKWTPIKVTLELVNMDGNGAAMAATVTLPAYGQVARFMRQLFPSLAGPFSGYLRVTSTGPISVSGLRGRYNERGDFLITTTQPQNEASTPSNSALVFPQIVGGGGYSTQFILFGESGAGNINFYSQTGSAPSGLFRIP